MASLQIGMPLVVYDGLSVVGLSTNFFAVPPGANLIVWSMSWTGSITADVALHGSLSSDGIPNQHIDSDNGGVSFVRQVVTAAPFVAVHMDTIDADVPVVITLTAKHKKP